MSVLNSGTLGKKAGSVTEREKLWTLDKLGRTRIRARPSPFSLALRQCQGLAAAEYGLSPEPAPNTPLSPVSIEPLGTLKSRFPWKIFPQSSAPNCKVTFWAKYLPAEFREIPNSAMQPRFCPVFVAGCGNMVQAATISGGFRGWNGRWLCPG